MWNISAGRRLSIAVAASAALLAHAVRSEPVFVSQSGRSGAGYTFIVRDQCHVVTAAHIVTDDEPFEVSDYKRVRSKAQVVARPPAAGGAVPEGEFDPFDMVVGRLASAGPACTTLWQDGVAARVLLESPEAASTPLAAVRVLGNGSLRQQRLLVRELSNQRMDLAPFGKTDRFEAGDSGTFLTVAGANQTQLVGMIVRIETAEDAIVALPLTWMHAQISSVLQAKQELMSAINVGIGAITLANRPLDVGPALTYETVKSVAGLKPTLGDQGHITLVANVLSAKPSLKRNDCYTPPGKINIACTLMGRANTLYFGTVPVQIDFRINDHVRKRVVPFLYSQIYSTGGNTNQDAQAGAIAAGLNDGTLAALVESAVVRKLPQEKNKKQPAYVVDPELLSQLTQMASASQTPDRGSFAGRWNGTYVCSGRSTAMTLDISLADAGAKGLVRFCNGATRSIPAGSWQYGVQGRVNTASDRLELLPLRADQDPNLKLPRGYFAVGLALDQPSAGTMNGRMLHASCATVELRRLGQGEGGTCD